jgi:hypothetical protein
MIDTEVHFFTSASFAYLDRVRVLGETLRRYYPNWTFWLCLSDAGRQTRLHLSPLESIS